MDRFLKKIFIFSIPFLLFYVTRLVFYSSEYGDLSRIGYLIKQPDYYENPTFLEERRILFKDLTNLEQLKGEEDIVLVIGDSFSNQGYNSFHNFLGLKSKANIYHLSSNLQSINQLAYAFFILESGFLDSVDIKTLIIEFVERESPSLQKKKYKIGVSPRTENEPVHQESNKWIPTLTDYKFMMYNVLYKFNDHAFFSPVYKFTLKKKLFSVSEIPTLIVYGRDITQLTKTNKLELAIRLNDDFNELEKKLSKKNIELIIVPAPNKYSVYYQYTDSSYGPSKFFRNFSDLPKKYTYLDTYAILLNEIEKGTKDLYYFDDSHWSPIGAKIIGEKLAKEIE